MYIAKLNGLFMIVSLKIPNQGFSLKIYYILTVDKSALFYDTTFTLS